LRYPTSSFFLQRSIEFGGNNDVSRPPRHYQALATTVHVSMALEGVSVGKCTISESEHLWELGQASSWSTFDVCDMNAALVRREP
jgi:hypothetical protein